MSILKDFLEQSLTDEVDEINIQLKAEYDGRLDKLLAEITEQIKNCGRGVRRKAH